MGQTEYVLRVGEEEVEEQKRRLGMIREFKENQRLQLAIFIFVVLISGWLGVLLDSMLTEQPKGNSLGMGLWLVLPFFTVLLLRFISRDWKGFGVKLHFRGNLKWYLVSLVIYPIVTILTVGTAWLFGFVRLSHFESNTFFSLVAVALFGSFVKNIFEEFSWRGYLTPKLIELKLNDWLLYLISGLVWALWHMAYYLVLLPDEVFESLSRVGYVWSGCVIMVCWAVMYVELYRLTRSVWPCVLMHAMEDAIPTVLVTTSGVVTLKNPGDLLLNPTYGVITTVLFLGIGLLLRAIRIKKEQRENMNIKRSLTI